MTTKTYPVAFTDRRVLGTRALLVACVLGHFGSPSAYAQAAGGDLPEEKQTTLGLYVDAREAYEIWKAAPDRVKILDVRTPEEYIFVGHAPMAVNIPAFLQTYQWDRGRGHYAMKPNPDFLAQIRTTFTPEDKLYVMCRSGGRSAAAVNQLAAAGFKFVYNITDGFEGDTVAEPGSLYHGKRMKNGWKNSGIPWTYVIDPDLMRLQKGR